MPLSHQISKQLIHQMPIGVCVWDTSTAKTPSDCRLLYANQWALHHLIRTVESPTGKTIYELASHYGRAPNVEFMEGVFISARDQVAQTVELDRVSGHVYRIHYHPVGDMVTASIFEDITAISDANMNLSMALESAKAGMWFFDYVENTQSWDIGTATLAGLGAQGTLEDASLTKMLSCISSKDASDIENLLTRLIETPGASHAELEFRLVRPNGQQVTVMDRVTFKHSEERLLQATHVLVDITDKAHLNAQLQQSNSDLKNFAHVASHDLREPLRVIVNYVSMLFEEHGDKLTHPDAQQYREFIETSAVRAMSLVDDLLRFSRAGSNVFTQMVSLGRLVRIATENLKISIEEVNADIQFSELPQVLCDPGMLIQVLQNLIGNAVKFSARGTTDRPVVKIAAEEQADKWVISVADTGIGVEAEYLQKIFTPFYRLYSAAEYAGTGIGLALCLKIIRAHDGEIWAESGGTGAGTTLYFTLPKPTA